MALLAYCITETSAALEVPRIGLGGADIEGIEHEGLRCFVSQDSGGTPLSDGEVREAALSFHRVLEKIFEQTAIIPFRFPTILPGRPELADYLAEHSMEYHASLTRLRDLVQMEIRLQFKGSPPFAEPSGSEVMAATKLSGTEYLRKIQARHGKLGVTAGKFRQASLSFTKGWRQRDSNEGIRCFALIERALVSQFQMELQAVAIEPGLDARLSGPWPATQFLKEE